MIDQNRFEQICDYTRQYLRETGAKRDPDWVAKFPRSPEHRWRHTLNVLANAEQILAGEGADGDSCDVVRVAAILHDISMFVCDHQIHGRVSAEIAGTYLLEQGYPGEFVARVSRAIAEHGTDLGPLPPEQQGALFSWEGKVVLEADILDKLGASAITDNLLMLGKKDYLGAECLRELAHGRAMQRAAFFNEYIWTETGRRLAAQRFAFFQMFLKQLSEEVVEIVNA